MTTVFLPLAQRITHNLCSKTRNRQLRELRKTRLRVNVYSLRERVCTFRTSVSRAVATHIFYFFLLMDVRVPQRPAGRTLVALVFGCQLYLGGCVCILIEFHNFVRCDVVVRQQQTFVVGWRYNFVPSFQWRQWTC